MLNTSRRSQKFTYLGWSVRVFPNDSLDSLHAVWLLHNLFYSTSNCFEIHHSAFNTLYQFPSGLNRLGWWCL